MNANKMSPEDVEEIKEMYKEYGWSVRKISEEFDMDMDDVKRIVGEKPDTSRTISSQEGSGKGYRKQLQKERETITSFRDKGLAYARCPKCRKIMKDVVEDEEGYHYACGSCGYEDIKDVSCNDKCCRRGLVEILSNDPEAEITEEGAEAFIEGE